MSLYPKSRIASRSIGATPVYAFILSCAITFAFVTIARADDPGSNPSQSEAVRKLDIGHPVPALEIEQWLKGEPITGFESGRVYVVEFWATWCGPCRAGMPHLTELQRKYRDQGVTIIGVASDYKHPQTVVDFVQDNDDRMGYHVAIDRRDPDANGQSTFRTDAAYMGQTGMRGIPCAYVIDRDGRLAWFGFPPPYFDYVLDDVVNGRFDPRRQRAIEAEAAQITKEFDLADIRESGDWQAASAKIDRYRSLHPAHADDADWMEFRVLLFCAKDYDAAYALANRWMDRSKKPSADDMNRLAGLILENPSVERRDFSVALRAAKAAVEANNGEYYALLAQLAKAHMLNGEIDEAIVAQQRAIDAASKSDQSEVESLQATLKQYRESQRTP